MKPFYMPILIGSGFRHALEWRWRTTSAVADRPLSLSEAPAPVLPRRPAKDDHGWRDNPEECPYTPLAGGRRLYPPVKGGRGGGFVADRPLSLPEASVPVLTKDNHRGRDNPV